MPFVADAQEPATDPVGELLAEFARPLPHRFVANDDAAGRQQFLYPRNSWVYINGEVFQGVASYR